MLLSRVKAAAGWEARGLAVGIDSDQGESCLAQMDLFPQPVRRHLHTAKRADTASVRDLHHTRAQCYIQKRRVALTVSYYGPSPLPPARGC
jgi:hypothetical protein